jgi:rubrerythrin
MDKNKIPPYMRTSMSASYLAKNPQYKKYFRKCGGCSKFSLKPAEREPDGLYWRCRLCGYVLKEEAREY